MSLAFRGSQRNWRLLSSHISTHMTSVMSLPKAARAASSMALTLMPLPKAAQAASSTVLTSTASARALTSNTPGRMRGGGSGQTLRIELIEEFRSRFWKAAAARASERNCPAMEKNEAENNEATAVPPMPRSRAAEKISPRQDRDEAEAGRAREKLFQHFHASAVSRAMKRHDVVMTQRRSPDVQVGSIQKHEGGDGVQKMQAEPVPSLVDVATSMKAREAMRRHFWLSHRRREDARNRSSARLAAHDSKPLDKHRFKLPKTLNAYFEAGRRGEEHHPPCPMVITETHSPFTIVDVNQDWTELCGYTRQEAVGSTLALLQGPETDAAAVKDLIASLLRHDNGKAEHEAVLVNYKSNGETFKNHVRVGHVTNESGDTTTHFVGLFAKLD